MNVIKHQFWWEMLPAVPRSRDSQAYRRLRRCWFDHTVTNHPFLSVHCEDHLTPTLFENFVLFEPQDWLEPLLCAAGITPPMDRLSNCNWAYQAQDRKTNKMADVGIHARGPAGDCAILVEAKVKGGPLKKADVNPDSYLQLAEFADFAHRYLIYLVDEQDVEKTRRVVIDENGRSGTLTWQRLGGLQIELALQLTCEGRFRDFIAGAIQYQYLNHGIRPTKLVADYLAAEPSRADINKTNPDKMTSWRTTWKIP
jgi:hypothetical protein